MPRKAVPLPPLTLLRSMFDLTDEGRLVNKMSRTSRVAGAFADEHLRKGYRSVYATRLLFAHRVVWAMFYGEEPPENIDHIDGDLLNNRPRNLRATTHSQNMCNARVHRHSASGIKGVHKRKDNGMWRAYISKGGKRLNIGQFASMEEASNVLAIARKEMHGNFAREG